MDTPLLKIKDLKTYFHTSGGLVRAVDGVNLSISERETVGVVGESGCGKSVTALSVMRLIPDPPGKIMGGEVLLEGEDILGKSEAEMRSIRGSKIAMIFQEPMTSLNPLYTVGDQIIEVIVLHQKLGAKQSRTKAIELLRRVGIPSPERRVDEYPHQMSGGMRQRVMIAMALSCNPRILIADEPTTALDVTIQAQILDLMRGLRREFGTGIMLITHDLGIVAELADRVVVMYAGQVVESASVNDLFSTPTHPYTLGLLGSIPKLNEKRDRLQVIEGVVPTAANMPSGCRFHPRCSLAMDICRAQEPDLVEIAPSHHAKCFLATRSGNAEVSLP